MRHIGDVHSGVLATTVWPSKPSGRQEQCGHGRGADPHFSLPCRCATRSGWTPSFIARDLAMPSPGRGDGGGHGGSVADLTGENDCFLQIVPRARTSFDHRLRWSVKDLERSRPTRDQLKRWYLSMRTLLPGFSHAPQVRRLLRARPAYTPLRRWPKDVVFLRGLVSRQRRADA